MQDRATWHLCEHTSFKDKSQLVGLASKALGLGPVCMGHLGTQYLAVRAAALGVQPSSLASTAAGDSEPPCSVHLDQSQLPA